MADTEVPAALRTLVNAWALPLLLAVPAEAAFFAAAGKVDITPDLETETVYLAGYGASGKKAKGVRDPLYVRALVVSDGINTAALVSIDVIGLYRNDVMDLRRRTGVPVFLAATHTHSGPDTLGLWGPVLGVSGVNHAYQERIKFAAASLVNDLAGSLQPAELFAAETAVNVENLLHDRRDPVILDPTLNLLSVRGADGAVIATGVRFSCHATFYGRERDLISADFPGSWCTELERKHGGTCLFLPGSIGGHSVPKPGLEEFPFPEAAPVFEPLEAAGVRFSSRGVLVPVENSRYLLFLPSLAFGHALYKSDGTPLPAWKRWWLPLRHLIAFPLAESARPWVRTEVSLLELGGLRILGIPGESFPEQAIGGYAAGVIGASNPNPPRIESAPKGPFLKERLGSKHAWIVNLANDEIGYTIPAYDFQAAPTRSMKPRPPGTHYGETNSIGPRATDLILDAARELIAP